MSSTENLAPPPRSREERRRSVRRQFVTRAMLYRDNGARGPQRINLKDVSLLGLGFETAAPVEPGMRCRIVIEAGPTRIQWRLKIVCCGKIEAELYRVGCEFIPAPQDHFNEPEESLALDDLQSMLIPR